MRRLGLLAVVCSCLSSAYASAQEKTALPDGAVARLGMHRLRVPGSIRDSAFTSDHRTMVIAHDAVNGDAPNVAIFDCATGLQRGTLAVKQARFLTAARQKLVLAVANHESIDLWDMHAEKRVRGMQFLGNLQSASALAISHDGAQIAAAIQSGNEAVILRWNAETGAALPSLHPKTKSLHSIQYSADGSKLFSVTLGSTYSDGKKTTVTPGAIIAWDVKNGTKLTQRTHDGNLVAISPDGTLLARGPQGNVLEIVDFDPESNNSTIIPVVGQPTFDFTPDGKQLAILVHGQPIRIWDIAQKKETRTLDGRIWAYRSPPRISSDGALIAAMQGDGRGYDTNQVAFWNLKTGKQIQFATGHPSTVNGLAYSPDGKRLATFSQNLILIYNPLTGAELHRWPGHTSSVEQIAFSPDGKTLASGSVDGTLALWDPISGQEMKRFNLKESVKSLAFGRDGNTITAACSEGSLQIWDLKTSSLLRRHAVPVKMASAIFSSTGQLFGYYALRFPQDPVLHLMNARTGRSFPSIDLNLVPAGDDELRRSFEYTIAWDGVFSPDGKLLVTSDGVQTQSIRAALAFHTVRVWELATRREIMRFFDNPIGTRLLAVSSDNRVLAHGVGGGAWGRGTDKAVILRDIREARNESLSRYNGKGEEISKDDPLSRFRQIDGHRGNVICIAFSPDGKFLATGGADQVVYVWRVEHFFKRPPLTAATDDASTLWTLLGDANAGKAYRAIAQLEAKPNESLALLRREMRAVPRVDEQAIRQHLRDLASSTFATRQQAYNALERAAEQAGPLLEAQLKSPNNLEVRRRVEALLERLERPLDEVSQLRAYRALTLLERIGSDDARRLLAELAQGAPSAWLTGEARHSLRQIQRGD